MVEVIATVDAEKLEIGLSLKSVSPVPFGAIVISPLEPSVMVIEPVVEFHVFRVAS